MWGGFLFLFARYLERHCLRRVASHLIHLGWKSTTPSYNGHTKRVAFCIWWRKQDGHLKMWILFSSLVAEWRKSVNTSRENVSRGTNGFIFSFEHLTLCDYSLNPAIKLTPKLIHFTNQSRWSMPTESHPSCDGRSPWLDAHMPIGIESKTAVDIFSRRKLFSLYTYPSSSLKINVFSRVHIKGYW